MATGTTCIYKSVTLQQGETFVLPPGAELIGSTNESAITSSCDEEFDLEEIQCYTIQVQESISDGGDAAYNDVYITEATLNGTTTIFSTPISFDNCSGCIPTSSITQLQNALNEMGILGAFSDWSGYADEIPNSGDAAMVIMICFKTFPSIAQNLIFKAYGDQDGSAPDVPIIIPILTADQMLTQYLGGGGYDDFVNACSCYN